ncbi:MAG: hypothetical protein H6Q73_3360 [Firmicutes bacterium]|nr:hypothetical protein [Bacillota bacterium]
MERIYYRQLLSHYIKHSGLSLRQIAQQCRERNHSIDPSYISKLQSGHLPPPSEEVSKTLAEVLGANAEELIYLGYIEKAPATIRQRLYDHDMSAEFLCCARRISQLSPLFRQKLMDELQWLEELKNHNSTPG